MGFMNRIYLQKRAKVISIKRSNSRGIRSVAKTLSNNNK